MRHLKAGRKLGRSSAHRKALFRNMVTSLIRSERIRTTLAKAKELRSKAEKTITLGKRGTLHARRLALRNVSDKEVLSKLFGPLSERYANRNGGYTRIIKIGNRRGDDAPMAIIELVDREGEQEPEKPVKGKGKKAEPVKKKAEKKGAPKKEAKKPAEAKAKTKKAKAEQPKETEKPKKPAKAKKKSEPDKKDKK